MLAQSPLEQHQLEAVPGGRALRDRIPAGMLDGHAGFVAHRFEAYLDLGRLSGREARQTPAEGEVFAGRPAPHRADLPFLAVGEAGDEAAAGSLGVETERAVALRRERKERVARPPAADVAGKDGEGRQRPRGDAQRDDDRRPAQGPSPTPPTICPLTPAN